MDSTIGGDHDNIREIEDIIVIQKANGNFSARQVAFSLPAKCGEGESAMVARSEESALARRSSRGRRRKRGKRRASPQPDAVSWPSASDITVLRLQGGEEGGRARPGAAPGDGLHRADGSSMVNLATLVACGSQSPAPPASKHSLVHELLLPLSSWERPAAPSPVLPAASARERLARFLRLYFCPCCTCLYEMEKNMHDKQSVYLTTSRRPHAPSVPAKGT